MLEPGRKRRISREITARASDIELTGCSSAEGLHFHGLGMRSSHHVDGVPYVDACGSPAYALQLPGAVALLLAAPLAWAVLRRLASVDLDAFPGEDEA